MCTIGFCACVVYECSAPLIRILLSKRVKVKCVFVKLVSTLPRSTLHQQVHYCVLCGTGRHPSVQFMTLQGPLLWQVPAHCDAFYGTCCPLCGTGRPQLCTRWHEHVYYCALCGASGCTILVLSHRQTLCTLAQQPTLCHEHSCHNRRSAMCNVVIVGALPCALLPR